MDSFEINKILGAVLATCLVLLITSFTANAVFTPKPPATPANAAAIPASGWRPTLLNATAPSGISTR